jgi:hypothetical protein
MKEDNKNIELRSEKVRYLLEVEYPYNLMACATVLHFAIFLFLLFALCLPFPHSEGECILLHLLEY